MKERIPDRTFKLMSLIIKVMETVHPHAEERKDFLKCIKI